MPKRPGDMFKITQTRLNNRWTTNALKSIGIITKQTLSDLAPNISEVAEPVANTSRSIYNDLIKNKNGLNKVVSGFNSNKYIETARNAYQSAINQLKTGNFADEDAATNAFMGNQQSGGVSFNDEDTGDTYNIQQGASDSAIRSVGQEINRAAVASVQMAKANMDAMISVNSAAMQQRGQLGAEIINRLDNINNNLATLVKFNTDNMSKFIESSLAYYEKTGAAIAGDRDNGSSKITAGMVLKNSNGGLDVANYKKYVAQQFKKAVEGTQIGSMMSMIPDEMLDAFAANPIGMLAPMMVTAVLPGTIKNTIKLAEEKFTSLVPNMLMEIGRWGEGGDNSILGQLRQIVGKTFGIKVDERERNLAAAKVNRDAIPFDGETKHAITEIITKELREQTSYLRLLSDKFVGPDSGVKAKKYQSVFDYGENRYINAGEIDKRIAQTLVDAITAGFDDSNFGKNLQAMVSQQSGEAYDKIITKAETKKSQGKNVDMKAAKAKAAKVQEEMNRAYQRALGQFYNEINSRENDEVSKEDLLDMIDDMNFGGKYGDDIQKTLKARVTSMSDREIETITGARYKAGQKRTEAVKHITKNASEYHLYGSRFNNANMTAEETARAMEEELGYKYYDGRADRREFAKNRNKSIRESRTTAENFSNAAGTIDSQLVDRYNQIKSNASVQEIKKGLTVAGNIFSTGLSGWVETLFGRQTKDDGSPESDKEMKERVWSDFKDTVKTELPGIKIGAGIGAGVSLLTGLVINPIAGAAIGAAGAMLSHNERFMTWLFGKKEQNENGDFVRSGGIIPAPVQWFLKEHKIDLSIGAGLGAGAGLLGMIAGGPVAGALMGLAAATVKNTGMFQRFLFGDKDAGIPGFFSGIAEAFNKYGKNAKLTQDSKILGMGVTGAATGALLAKFGILGGALMPFGPVGGAMLGLAAGITASGVDIRKYLFGGDEVRWKDAQGNDRVTKTKGLIGRIGATIETEIINPVKTKLLYSIGNLFVSIEQSILNPIKFTSIFIAKNAGKILSSITNLASKTVVRMVTAPFKLLGKVFEPLTKLAGNAMKMAITQAIDIPRAMMDIGGGLVTGLIGKLDPSLASQIKSSRAQGREARAILKKQRVFNKKHDKNAKLIRKLTNGLYSEDTQEARDYIRSIDEEAYEKYFGENALKYGGQVEAKDTVAKAAKNAAISKMSYDELLKTHPEVYYQRKIYDYIIERGEAEDRFREAVFGPEAVQGGGSSGAGPLTEFQRQREEERANEQNARDAIEANKESGYYRNKVDRNLLTRFLPGFVKNHIAERNYERDLDKAGKTAMIRSELMDEWMNRADFDNSRVDFDNGIQRGLFGYKLRRKAPTEPIKKNIFGQNVLKKSLRRFLPNIHRLNGGEVTSENGEITTFNEAGEESAISPHGTMWFRNGQGMPVYVVGFAKDAEESLEGAAEIANDDAEEKKSELDKIKEAGLDKNEQDAIDAEKKKQATLESIDNKLGNVTEAAEGGNRDNKGKRTGKGILGFLGGLAKGFADTFSLKGILTAGLILMIPSIIKHLPEIVKFAVDTIPKAFTYVRDEVIPKVKTAFDFLDENIFTPIGNFIVEHGESIVNFVTNVVPTIGAVVTKLAEKLGIYVGAGIDTVANAMDESNREAEEAKRVSPYANGMTKEQSINNFFDRSVGEHLSLVNKDNGAVKSNATSILNAAAHIPQVGKWLLHTAGMGKGPIGTIAKTIMGRRSVLDAAKAGNMGALASSMDNLAELAFTKSGKATWNNKLVSNVERIADKGKNLISKPLNAAANLADNAVEFAGSGRGGKLLQKVTEILQKVFTKIGAPAKAIKGVFDFLKAKWNSMVVKISEILGGRVSTTTISLGLTELIGAGLGAINGSTGAAKLFHVDKEYVDNTMIKISTGLGALAGTTPGSILELIFSTYASFTGEDMLHNIAVGWYKAINKDRPDAVKKLDEGLRDFDKDYEKYQNEQLEKAYAEQCADGTIDPQTVSFEAFKAGVAEGKYKANYMSKMEYNADQHRDLAGNIIHGISDAAGWIKKNAGSAIKAVGAGIANFGKNAVAGVKSYAQKGMNWLKTTNLNLKNKGINIGQVGMALATGPFGMAALGAGKAINMLYDRFAKKATSTVYRPVDQPLTYFKADKGGKTFSYYNNNGDLIAESNVTAEQLEQMQKDNLVKEDTVELDSRSAGLLDQIKGIGASLKEGVDNVIKNIAEGAKTLGKNLMEKAGGIIGKAKDQFDKFKKSPAGAFLINIAKVAFGDKDTKVDTLYNMVGEKKKVKIYRPIDQPLCYYMADEDGKTYSLYNSNGDVVSEKAITADELFELKSNSLVTEDDKEVADKEVKTSDKVKGILKGVREKLGTMWNDMANVAKSGMEKLGSTLKNLGAGLFGVDPNGGKGGFGFGGFGNADSFNGGTYYSQKDGRWANMPYGMGFGPTMRNAGCGPAAFAMAASDVTGRRIRPDAMANLAQASGNVDASGTNWDFINTASAMNGIRSGQTLNPSGARLQREVGRGGRVILNGVSGDNGPYTRSGHYIVAEGLTRDGRIRINDPRGKEYSKSVDANTLARSTRSAWTLGGRGFGFGGFGADVNSPEYKAALQKARLGATMMDIKAGKYFGDTDMVPDSSTAWKDSSYYDEFTDANGGVDEAARVKANVTRGNYNFIDVFLAVAREIKSAIAASGTKYSQSSRISVTLGDGRTLSVRPDCSGFTSSVLTGVGHFSDNYVQTSGYFLGSSAKYLEDNGWTHHEFTSWDDCQPGDIIARSGHVEIFSRNQGGQHYVYNCGLDKSVANPDETTDNNGSYKSIWRPSPDAKSSYTPASKWFTTFSGDYGTSGGPGAASSGVSGNASVDGSAAGTKSGIGDIWSKLITGFTAIGGELMNRVFSGNKNKDFDSVWKKAIYGEDATSGNATVSDSADGSVSAANLTGSNEKEKIWNFLIQNGMTPMAAAGMMGCWESETGNRAARIEGDYLKSIFPGWENLKTYEQLNDYTVNKLFPKYKGGISKAGYMDKKSGMYLPGLGLAQWTGPRAARLMEYAKSKGGNWQDLPMQLEYFLNGEGEFLSRSGLKESLNSAGSPEDAATIFLDGFEMSKGFSTKNDKGRKYNAERRANALAIYNMYKDLKPSDATVKDTDYYDTMVDADGAVVSSKKNASTANKDEDYYEANMNADGSYGKGGFGIGPYRNYSAPRGGRGPQITGQSSIGIRPTKDTTTINNKFSSISPDQIAKIIEYLAVIANATNSSDSKLDMLSKLSGGGNNYIMAGESGSGKTNLNEMREKNIYFNDKQSTVAKQIARGGVN